jgi:hypothetical protein
MDNIAFAIILLSVGLSLLVAAATALYDTDLVIRNTSISAVACVVVFGLLFDLTGSGFHVVARLGIAAAAVFLILTVWPERVRKRRR